MIVFNFHRLLEGHQIGAALFARVGELHLWGFTKVRYHGLAKRSNRAFVILALINLTKWGILLIGQVCPA